VAFIAPLVADDFFVESIFLGCLAENISSDPSSSTASGLLESINSLLKSINKSVYARSSNEIRKIQDSFGASFPVFWGELSRI
jgi:hypothetical protein